MGRWGTDTFQSDDACEYACGLARQLVAELDRFAADPELNVHDVDDEVAARLVVLAFLVERCRAHVDAAIVARWSARFLGVCDSDEGLDSYYRDEDVAPRRASIAAPLEAMQQRAG
ncbi:hypothetical protein GobsT_67420 [Gemmata obscuriglobus]|uniref:DUF4259 domain-containing protein n=1 Tax=Gemmata obscuriglobus TaxID=114 RepID=A0A2Z3GP65_9BACT|nr:hypothetical protein [Gemmata obscuriglobus]AWM35583.1 hypothetical protein C1280_00130 [Gemmata obscuriglobus]QEG31895.1 hypothetical protein GobsT_67420 [Gemmata obscuriglobus]VTS11241.1 unnamed protein product [Gemmata obscuriglobus UQM 2246]